MQLGTLAGFDLISASFSGAVVEKTFITSAEASWSVSNWTDAADVGPLMVGYAHSDYIDAEIEAFIENSGSWNMGLKTEQEIARRQIKIVGVLETPDSGSSDSILNDGVLMKTKLNWTLITGQTLRFWAYNLGSAAFATTDPDLKVSGHANLWPQ